MKWIKFVREPKPEPVRAGPPEGTDWARLIKANKAEKAARKAREQAALDAKKELNAALWRRGHGGESELAVGDGADEE